MEAKYRQDREDKLAELQEKLHREQGERRRADEDWPRYGADVAVCHEEIPTEFDFADEDYRPGIEDCDPGWWDGSSDDDRA